LETIGFQGFFAVLQEMSACLPRLRFLKEAGCAKWQEKESK